MSPFISFFVFTLFFVSPTKADDQRILSRHRRFFLPELDGATATVAFKLTVPLEDVSADMDITVPFTYTFATDSSDDETIATGASYGVIERHSHGWLMSQERQRHSLIEQLEAYLSEYVGSARGGRACMLRTLCELSATPRHQDGFLGDVVNLLVTPAKIVDNLATDNVYVRAQKAGRIQRDCSTYFPSCPHSLFEFIDGQVPVAGEQHHDYVYYDYHAGYGNHSHLDHVQNHV